MNDNQAAIEDTNGVSLQYGQALAYIWGRHDAGDKRVASVDFANAYSEYRHANGTFGLSSAYESYVLHGRIVED